MLVLLDTTVLIDFLRGRPAAGRVAALRQRGDRPCTTAINVEELVRGLLPDERDAAGDLVRGLRVVPIGADDGWRAGAWRREHAATGVTLSQADCLIAAVAVSSGALLATGNRRHFPMAGVEVEEWPVGA
ncbi:MAG: PIN domain-containing protein [Candidatus Dormibacteria bacterium]